MFSLYSHQADSEKNLMLSDFIENTTDSCNEILHLTEDLQSAFNSTNMVFLKNYDYMLYVLGQLGPVAGQLLNIIVESEDTDELSKREAEILIDSFLSLIHDNISEMLTNEAFERYPIDYLRGIERCNEVFKTKFKLGFQVRSQEESRDTKLSE
jgi:hypothetical protein